MSSPNVNGANGQQWFRYDLPAGKNKKQDKLADASARKLAKSILAGKMTTSGELKMKSLVPHTVDKLSQQLNQRLKSGEPKKIHQAFQRVKNFLTAGGRGKTDRELLLEAQADLKTKSAKSAAHAPQPRGRGLIFLARGNIAEIQTPGKKTVVVNSANTKLEWGRGGTNRALSDVIPKKEWEKVHGHTSHRPFARNPDRIVVGEAVKGPKISDKFEMIQALGPRLDAKTSLEDLPKLQMQVFEAYKNALKMARDQGAECVQVPQFCTGSFMRGASDEVKEVWPDMVNTAFLAAVQDQNADRSMKVVMVIPEGVPEPDFAKAYQGVSALNERLPGMHSESIKIVRDIAVKDGRVAFYKDGPTECFGNFCPVPGGFETGTPKVKFSNVEAALHYAKCQHAIAKGGDDAKKLASDPLLRELQLCKRGEEALKLGRALEKKYPELYSASASTWHTGVKQKAVFEALQAKFALQPFKALLEATGKSYLLEHKASPNAQDNYWSNGGDGRGVNALGIMLMAIRDGEEMPGLNINPNRKDYVPDGEVMEHTEQVMLGLDYVIYGHDDFDKRQEARERAEPEIVGDRPKKTVRWADPRFSEPMVESQATTKGKSTREVQATPIPKGAEEEYTRFDKSLADSVAFRNQRKAERKLAEEALKLKDIPPSFDRLTTHSIAQAIKRVGMATNNVNLSFDSTQRDFLDDCISQIVDAFIDSGEEMTPDKLKNELLKLLEKRNAKEDECLFEDWPTEKFKMQAHLNPEDTKALKEAYENGSWKAGEAKEMTWYIFPEYGEKGKGLFEHKLTSARAVISALCMDPHFISGVLSEIGQTTPVDLPVFHEVLSNQELLQIVDTDLKAAFELGKRYMKIDPEIAEQYLEIALEVPELNQQANELLRQIENFEPMPNLAAFEEEEKTGEESRKNFADFRGKHESLDALFVEGRTLSEARLDQLKDGLKDLHNRRNSSEEKISDVMKSEMDAMMRSLESKLEHALSRLPSLGERQAIAQKAYQDFNQLNEGIKQLRDDDSLKNALKDLRELRGKCGKDVNNLADLQQMDRDLAIAISNAERLIRYNQMKSKIEADITAALDIKNPVDRQDKIVKIMDTTEFQTLKMIEIEMNKISKDKMTFALDFAMANRRGVNG